MMKLITMTLFMCLLMFNGCKDPVVQLPEDHEVVTTVTYTFVDSTDTADVVTATWEDIDGVGGANPNRVDSIVLAKGKVYTCSVTLLNRSVSPAINLTEDILAEEDQHQFFYDVTNGVAQVSILDRDSRNLPVGLTFRMATSFDASAMPSALTMALYHFDDASEKTGADRGNETDIEITLPLVVR